MQRTAGVSRPNCSVEEGRTHDDVEGAAAGSAQRPSPSWKGSMETKSQAEYDSMESLMVKGGTHKSWGRVREGSVCLGSVATLVAIDYFSQTPSPLPSVHL